MESDFKIVKGGSTAKKKLDVMVSSLFSHSSSYSGLNGDEDDDSDTDDGEVEIFRRREVKKMFDLVDKDGSGYIDKTEMDKLLRTLGKNYSREEMNAGFFNIDKDCSGHIEFHEFYEWFKRIQSTENE